MKKCYLLYADNLSVSIKTFKNISNTKKENEMLPGKHIIKNLINYSKSLDVLDLKTIGKTALLTN